ncbi:MAG TPA: hypothetical protein VFG73_03690 [Rhodanobacteraceae bacterium]|nr:hypothetical protein [Rhodanobacteraceae bacterium]
MSPFLRTLALVLALLMLGGCMTTRYYGYDDGAGYYYGDQNDAGLGVVVDEGYYGDGYDDGYAYGYAYDDYGYGYGYGPDWDDYGYGSYGWAYGPGWGGFPWPLTSLYFGSHFGGWFASFGPFWPDPYAFGLPGWHGSLWGGISYVPFYFYSDARRSHQRRNRRDLAAVRAEQVRQARLRGERSGADQGIRMWSGANHNPMRQTSLSRRSVLRAITRTHGQPGRSDPAPRADVLPPVRDPSPARRPERMARPQRHLPVQPVHRRPLRTAPTRVQPVRREPLQALPRPAARPISRSTPRGMPAPRPAAGPRPVMPRPVAPSRTHVARPAPSRSSVVAPVRRSSSSRHVAPRPSSHKRSARRVWGSSGDDD